MNAVDEEVQPVCCLVELQGDVPPNFVALIDWYLKAVKTLQREL